MQRFIRLTTEVVVRRPVLWPVFRRPVTMLFERIAGGWDRRRHPELLEPYKRALDAIRAAPRRALDLGTGTGDGAVAIARRFPEAEVVGVDLSPAMLAEARTKLPEELAGRVRFVTADAAALPFEDASFDLVGHANMIPFFDELARVLSPGGHAVFAFSLGVETPIFVPFDRLRAELEARGFSEFADFSAARGTSLLARKAAAE